MYINAIRSFQHRLACEVSRTADAEYNSASRALEVAKAGRRQAELASQCFESVDDGRLHRTLGDITDREREIGIAFARYAVHGRTDPEGGVDTSPVKAKLT